MLFALKMAREAEEERVRAAGGSEAEVEEAHASLNGAALGHSVGILKGMALGSMIAPGAGTLVGGVVGAILGTALGAQAKTQGDNLKQVAGAAVGMASRLKP